MSDRLTQPDSFDVAGLILLGISSITLVALLIVIGHGVLYSPSISDQQQPVAQLITTSENVMVPSGHEQQFGTKGPIPHTSYLFEATYPIDLYPMIFADEVQ